MSSPSPGKRRMDTDVVKLYPSWRKRGGGLLCVGGEEGENEEPPLFPMGERGGCCVGSPLP